MKIIRSTKDLPKDFDINKYEGMDKLKPYEWYYLLNDRINIRFYFEKKENNINEEMLSILNQPLNIDYKFHKMDFDKFDIYNSDYNNLIESKAISDYTMFDFLMMEVCMHQARDSLGLEEHVYPTSAKTINFMDFYMETQKQEMLLKAKKEGTVFNEIDFLRTNGTLFKKRVPLFINPFLSNQQIIDDLIPYIENIRENLKIENDEIIEVTKSELLKWASYKILPIIDLILWGQINEYKITHSVLSAASHPTGEYGEDNLRKSILPIINKLLDDDYILMSALHSFAGHEIGKNPDSFFPEKKSIQKDRKKYVIEIVGKQLLEKDQE